MALDASPQMFLGAELLYDSSLVSVRMKEWKDDRVSDYAGEHNFDTFLDPWLQNVQFANWVLNFPNIWTRKILKGGQKVVENFCV